MASATLVDCTLRASIARTRPNEELDI